MSEIPDLRSNEQKRAKGQGLSDPSGLRIAAFWIVVLGVCTVLELALGPLGIILGLVGAGVALYCIHLNGQGL